MQIKINLKVFLFLLIFLITRQIKIYALLMCLALIHELGHVMAGIILGFKPESISIIPTGFSVKFKNDCKNYNKKIKLWISLCRTIRRQRKTGSGFRT